MHLKLKLKNDRKNVKLCKLQKLLALFIAQNSSKLMFNFILVFVTI